MEELKNLIKENYPKLPSELQQVVLSPNLKEKFRSVAYNHNLSEGQLQALKNETYFILLRLEKIENFEENLKSQLMVDQNTASEIAKEIDTKIIASVRHFLTSEPKEISKIKPEKPKTFTPRPAPIPNTKHIDQSVNTIPKQIHQPETENKGRYGVAPAKDLGTADFEWEGDVGGVEIEREKPEEEFSTEDLSKTEILEEIEHPPVYATPTPFEQKLKGTPLDTNNKQQPIKPATDYPEQNGDVNLATGQKMGQKPEIAKSETFGLPNEAEVEQARQNRYKGQDPYREPIE